MRNRCQRRMSTGSSFMGMLLLSMLWVLNPGTGIAAPPYTLTESWATTGFASPESALYDAGTGYIYVPNFSSFEGTTPALGDGFISRLNADGSVETQEWVGTSAGGGVLNDPKGMGVYNGMLYVADMNQLKAIDLATGLVANQYPVSGSNLFLNDVTVDSSGNIYVSDSNSNAIYRLDAGGTALTEWLNSVQTIGPNGLFAEEGRLVVGTSTGIFAVDLNDKTVTTLVAGVSWVDGIWGDGLGNYFFSDGGRIALLKSDGSVEDLLYPATGSADLSYAAGLNLILSPDLNQTVTAYQVVSSATPGSLRITQITTDLTAVPQMGTPVTVTATASGPTTIYYQFLYKAGYGTAAYNTPGGFVVAQAWSANNSATITFPSADNYIVIVQASEDPGGAWAFGDPQGGMNIYVGNPLDLQLSSITTSGVGGTPTAGEPVTVSATRAGSVVTYYQFLYKAGYGTAAYNTPGGFVVAQAWSTNNSAAITFPSADNYIVIVQASDDPGGAWAFGDAQGGLNIVVENP